MFVPLVGGGVDFCAMRAETAMKRLARQKVYASILRNLETRIMKDLA